MRERRLTSGQCLHHPLDPPGIEEPPEPGMRVEPRIAPNHASPALASVGGTTSATGCPRRVTTIGVPVRRTRSRTARQVALNSEIAMVFMGVLGMDISTIVTDYSPFCSRSRRQRRRAAIAAVRRSGMVRAGSAGVGSPRARRCQQRPVAVRCASTRSGCRSTQSGSPPPPTRTGARPGSRHDSGRSTRA